MTMPSATTTPASVSMAKLTTHRPMRQSLVLTVLLLLMVTGGPPLAQVHGLECVVCGEYNDDGTGAITPCLNYSAALVPRLRRVCPRSEHKFCIKYVSELSVVRDCVEECKEKEIWDTHTYCCNEDGCNAAVRYGQDDGVVRLAAVICLAIGVTLFGAHLRLRNGQPRQLSLAPERF